jgi:ribosomal protein S27AE
MKPNDEIIDVEPIRDSIITCPNCGQKNRIPNEHNLSFRCGKCKQNLTPQNPPTSFKNFRIKLFNQKYYSLYLISTIFLTIFGIVVYNYQLNEHNRLAVQSKYSPAENTQSVAPVQQFDPSKTSRLSAPNKEISDSTPLDSQKNSKKPNRSTDSNHIPPTKTNKLSQLPTGDSGLKQPAIAKTTSIAILREEPDQSSHQLRKLKAGETIFLTNKYIEGFAEIVHIASDTTGWIPISSISTKKKYIPPATVSPFVGEVVGQNAPPTAVVKNLSNYQITLVIEGESNHIPANGSKTIQPLPGSHPYRASAPGVIPTSGTQNFQTGYRYTWTFWVETHRY